MIAKATIDKVFDAARLEEVIGDFVQLKKSGANYKGLSPFSKENTPSFMVSPVKQIWKDFSSGKGGNVIAFLMEHEHFTYPEAIKYLANKYGIEVEQTEVSSEEKEKASHRESMYLLLEYAQKAFQNNLTQDPKGRAIGLSYFKERGFTDKTITDFKLGYALDTWDAFTTDALKDGYQLSYLEQTGLTIVKQDKRFDRFKGRVLFPIHSMSGRVVGFGGRILDSTKKAAKYVNSPESEVYHKSRVLYGIYQAKQDIARLDRCYLVEGYTDVLQMHQAGVKNVVASSGTALTPEQIRLIHRLTKNITVLFDGDAAGLRASLRGVDLILEQGLNVKVCTFADGEDPDSFAKNNSQEAINRYIEENAQDFIAFKTALLLEDAKNDPVKKADTIRSIVQSIAKIPDRIQQEVYVKSCSVRLDISEQVLFNTLAQIQNTKQLTAEKAAVKQESGTTGNLQLIKSDTPKAAATKINRLHILEYDLIKSLLLYGDLEKDFTDAVLVENDKGELITQEESYTMRVFEKIYLELQQDEIMFADAVFQDIYLLLIERFTAEKTIKIEQLMHEIAPELSMAITTILMQEQKQELHDWERKDILVQDKKDTVSQSVTDIILNLRCYLIDKRIEDLGQQTKMKNDGNQHIIEEIMRYHHLKRILAKRLNRVLY